MLSTGRSGQRASAGRRQRLVAFTLIELVVVVLILGILSAIAAVQFTGYVAGAQDAAAKEQLGSLTQMAVVSGLTGGNTETVSAAMFTAALGTFSDAPTPLALGAHAGGVGWSLLANTVAPTNKYQFSAGFDGGIGGATPVNNDSGTRAVVVARSDSGRSFATIVLASPVGSNVTWGSCETFPGATAADVLAGHCYTTGQPVPAIVRPTTAQTTTGPPQPQPSPSPVPAPSAPPVNWNTCDVTAATGATRATVSSAYIATGGDSAVYWSVSGPTTGIVGFKICAIDQVSGARYLVAGTGNGTGTARTWLVPTNRAHPNVFLGVVTVMEDGSQVPSTNSREVAPAGAAKGWSSTPGPG